MDSIVTVVSKKMNCLLRFKLLFVVVAFRLHPTKHGLHPPCLRLVLEQTSTAPRMEGTTDIGEAPALPVRR